jgi:putative transposase
MADKFRNKYRNSSARLRNWDYSKMGSYFVTICTKNREHFFGEIINGEMHLNELGKIAESEWLKTIEIRQDMNLELREFVVMPNHFHAIVIIGKNEFNSGDVMHCNPTTNTLFENQPANKFGPQSKNLASIIRGYKSAVTTFARKSGNTGFNWQTRFYDHIIRNSVSFKNIQNYIIKNPLNWETDKFYE